MIIAARALVSIPLDEYVAYLTTLLHRIGDFYGRAIPFAYSLAGHSNSSGSKSSSGKSPKALFSDTIN
jgi:hypothetical protein